MYGNFRKCGTRFYPVRSGAVRYKVLVMAGPGCVNLPERTGTNLITGTDPFKVGFCNIYIKYPIIL